MSPQSVRDTLHLVPEWIVRNTLTRPVVKGLSDGLSAGLVRAHERTDFAEIGSPSRDAILAFHGVGEDPDVGIRENIPTAQFRETIERLTEIAEFVPLAEVTAASDTRRVAVTFDDGLASVVENALPVLREFDVPATVFVNPAFVGDRNLEICATRHEIDRANGLVVTDDQVRLLADSRLISIGNHTQTHPDLTTIEDEAELRTEVVGAKQTLAERYGVRVESFSFPYGAYDDRVARLVADTHELSVTTSPGLIEGDRGPHGLPRINGNHSLARLEWELTPASEFLHRLRSPWRDTSTGPGEVG